MAKILNFYQSNCFWTYRHFKKYVSISLLIVSFFSVCSCIQKAEKRNEKSNELINLNDKSKKSKVEEDSLSIAILSTDGELIKNLKYSRIDIKGQLIEPTEYLNYIKGYPLEDTIIGDFNGDGNPEKAWFKEKGIQAFEDCQQNRTKKSCEGIILFSDRSIKPLKIDNCPFFTFKNERDLYGDGKDVIGVLPGWFTSSCRQYSVFTLSNGGWKLACPSIGNTLNMREAGILLIEKDTTKKGWVVIRESVDSYVSDQNKTTILEKYIIGSSCQWSNVVERRMKLN
jgi:hypothetical protein